MIQTSVNASLSFDYLCRSLLLRLYPSTPIRDLPFTHRTHSVSSESFCRVRVFCRCLWFYENFLYTLRGWIDSTVNVGRGSVRTVVGVFVLLTSFVTIFRISIDSNLDFIHSFLQFSRTVITIQQPNSKDGVCLIPKSDL